MDRKPLAREDLVRILSMDGTYQEMQEAIETKELTQDEHDHIMEFLLAGEEERKQARMETDMMQKRILEQKAQLAVDEAFKKVLADVEAAPVYETGKEEKKAWKDYRREVAQSSNTVMNAKNTYEILVDDGEYRINGLIKEYGEQFSGLEEAKQIWNLEFNQRELAVKTNQTIALALLDAEAKTIEAQAVARARRERLEPIMEQLKQGWEQGIESVKDFKKSVELQIEASKNTRDLTNRAENAGFHPIKDSQNRHNMKVAMQELKNVNEAKMNIKKMEDKLLEKANKIILTEYKKEHAFDGFKSMLKGQKQEIKEPEKIQDIEKAREILGNGSRFGQRDLKNIEKDMRRYQEIRQQSQAKLDKAMERVQNGISERRQEIKDIYQDIEKLGKDGMISQNEKKLTRLSGAIEKALEQTQFSKDMLSPEMQDYLKQLGREDLVQGSKIDLDFVEKTEEINFDEFSFDDIDVPNFDEPDFEQIEEEDIGREI